MIPKPPTLDDAGGSQFDELVEERIDLSPADSVAERIVMESAALIASVGAPLVSPLAPALVEIFKSVASVLGFVWQRRKAERARDLILGLYERLQSTRSGYVKKEEFQDLFEDVLRRTAEQPVPSRRETMKRIFLKIVEEPRQHVENRLLLRLADELPGEALKILAVLDRKLTDDEQALGIGHYALADRLGLQPSQMSWPLSYLVNASLLNEESLNITPGIGAAGDDLMYLLTPLGRAFVEYGRG